VNDSFALAQTGQGEALRLNWLTAEPRCWF